MKKTRVFILLLCMLLGGRMWASHSIYVYFKDGRLPYVVELAEKPVLTFEGSLFKLSNDLAIPRSEVDHFEFPQISNGIDMPEDAQLLISHEGNVLRVTGLDNKARSFQVFDLRGRSCPVDVNVEGTTATISLEPLSKGAYIVKIGNEETIKIIRK